MSRIKSSLDGKLPYQPWGDEELRQKAAKLWHTTGTIMVKPEWLKNDLDQQFALNIGKMMFGERKA